MIGFMVYELLILSVIEIMDYNSNCMVQECYLRNKGKTTPKPKKWHKALAEYHFLGCGVVLPEFLK